MARRQDGGDKVDELFDLSNINVEKVLTTGMVFDISKTPMLFDDDRVIDFEDEEELQNHDVFEKNIEEPFEQLWSKMPCIKSTNLIRKTIFNEGIGVSPNESSIVTILYSGYFDQASKPFMSCPKHSPSTFNLKEGGLMPGVEMAIYTMTVGEKSRFLIHYSLMYGDLGCEPFIPKRANCLVNIALLDIKDNNHSNDRYFIKVNDFESAIEKANKIEKDGNICLSSSDVKKALKYFLQSLHMLQYCKLANYEEEIKQRNYVSALYLKLAWCYNELHQPKLACCMCNDFFKYTMNKKNAEPYFHYGKALIALGAYDEAAEKFLCGLKIDPKNEELSTQLKMLKVRMGADRIEKELCLFEKLELKDEKVDETVSKEFVHVIENLCGKIAADETIASYDYTLPPGLTAEELSSIELMAITFKLSTKIHKDIVTFTKTNP